ncbi:MAG: hypothetical protein WA981_15740 [Glaciecola sp.]
MNKIINIVLSGLLWRRYKLLIVSLIVLVASIFIIGKVHSDYLAYVQTSQTPANVGWSFAVKWGAWFFVLLLFLLVNHLANKQKDKQAVQDKPNKTLSAIIVDKFKGKKESIQTPRNTSQNSTANNQDNDPFAQLREKDKLRSYADLLIEKNKKK